MSSAAPCSCTALNESWSLSSVIRRDPTCEANRPYPVQLDSVAGVTPKLANRGLGKGGEVGVVRQKSAEDLGLTDPPSSGKVPVGQLDIYERALT